MPTIEIGDTIANFPMFVVHKFIQYLTFLVLIPYYFLGLILLNK